MKSNYAIILVLAKVMVIVSLLAFILIGFSAAYISWEIEREILTKIFPDTVVSLAFVAGVFEVGKVGLVIVMRIFSATNTIGFERSDFILPYRILLTASILCSLTYCLWQTCNPEKESKLAVGQEKIEVEYDQRVEEVSTHFDIAMREEASSLSKIIAMHDSIVLAERFVKNKKTGKFNGDRFDFSLGESEKFRKELSTLPQKYQKLKRSEIDLFLIEKEDQLEKLELESEEFIFSGNKVILAILTMINMGRRDFGNWQYISLALLVSLILTGAIESLIVVSFGFVALLFGREFEMFLQGQKTMDIAMNLFDLLQRARKKAQQFKNEAVKELTEDMIRVVDEFIKTSLEAIKEYLNINNKTKKDAN